MGCGGPIDRVLKLVEMRFQSSGSTIKTPGKASERPYSEVLLEKIPQELHVQNNFISSHASFWGDAYIVRKWMRNLRTNIWKCIPTKRSYWLCNYLLKQHQQKFVKLSWTCPLSKIVLIYFQLLIRYYQCKDKSIHQGTRLSTSLWLMQFAWHLQASASLLGSFLTPMHM